MVLCSYLSVWYRSPAWLRIWLFCMVIQPSHHVKVNTQVLSSQKVTKYCQKHPRFLCDAKMCSEIASAATAAGHGRVTGDQDPTVLGDGTRPPDTLWWSCNKRITEKTPDGCSEIDARAQSLRHSLQVARPSAAPTPQQPGSKFPTGLFWWEFQRRKMNWFVGSFWGSSLRAAWEKAQNCFTPWCSCVGGQGGGSLLGKLVPFPARLGCREGFTGALHTPSAAPQPRRSSCCSHGAHTCLHGCVLHTWSF